MKKNSPFKLCYSNPTAFGVTANKDITSNQYLTTYLTGSVQPHFQNKQWFSQKSTNEGNLPIVGSISFINHGCPVHSNVKVQWVDQYNCHIIFVKKIKKGEELLYNYPKENRYCYQTSSKFICIRCQESVQKSERIKRKIQTSERNKCNDSSKKTKKLKQTRL